MKKVLPIILMFWPYLFGLVMKVEVEWLLTILFWGYCILTVVVYISNIVYTFQCKNPVQLAVYNVLIKLVHIPFFVVMLLAEKFVSAFSVIPFAFIFTDILLWVILVVDILLLWTSSMYGIRAICLARKYGQVSGVFTVVNVILHLIFVADVISAVIVLCNVRKIPSYKL